MITRIRRVSAGLAALLLGLAFHGSSMADTIAIIGTGNVAGALGPEFAAQGHDIIYGSREPDIVVLAVPGVVAEEVAAGLGDLSGKIVLDPTNRLERRDDGYAHYVLDTSNAELVQAAAPGSSVVKAFNTLNYRTMIEPGGPVTIPLAGDDADAKARIAELVTGMGLEPVDVGPLSAAKVLEGMLAIWVNARSAGTPYDYHFRQTGD